ncbi:MAG: STAS domain-containing protein [Erysipelotrichaceae bacterium]|jgi:anti-sigma B factor antagonist|nr:STAS domain-containing protein [Erysipelotrichaceae bacterium]
MMIRKSLENDVLTVFLSGRLDTSNSAEFDSAVRESVDSVNEVVLDMRGLEYTSSSGLRVILALHKLMDGKGGKLVLRNVNSYIMEIFDVTGFSDILTIEK